FNNGQVTLVGSATLATISSPVNLQLDVQGNSLKFYVAGVLQVSGLDNSITGPGAVGLVGVGSETYHTFSATALAPTLPFSDAFSGSGALNPANWQVQAGSFSQSGGAATATGGNVLNLATYSNASVADISVSAQQVSLVGSGARVGLVARYTSANTCYMALLY